jgi:adenylate cyclase
LSESPSQVQQKRPLGILGHRRYSRPANRRPTNATRDSVIDWLRGAAHAVGSPIKLIDGLAWRLVAAGVPVDRVGVSVSLLHPQFAGYGIRWQRDTGESEETLIEHGVRDSDAYRNSPFPAVFERGETVLLQIGPLQNSDPYPIIADLRAQGYTGYLAQPARLYGFLPSILERPYQAVNWATKCPGGFVDADVAYLANVLVELAGPLTLVTERRIARDLLSIYLGRSTGPRVLAGEILRGAGEPLRAAILATDMRGFTMLNDRLPAARVIEILNAWFERQVDAVHSHGGEVLKFMGDGMLAIFPIADVEFARMAARDALAAARDALKAARAMDADDAFADARPLRAVAALHTGEIFHGNIGARDRLDFTAIGPSVNVVSRLESLAKQLDRELIVSAAFAAISPEALTSLGSHRLKGVADPVEAFTCPSDAAAAA